MAETLAEVKRTYGPNAIILNTRTLSEGGLFGLGGKPRVEITAAPDYADLPKPLRRGRIGQEGRGDQVRAEGSAMPGTRPRRTPPAPEPSVQTVSHDALLNEVGSLKSMVKDLVRETRRAQASEVPEQLFDTYSKLVEHEVAEKLAKELIDDVRSQLGDDELANPGAVRARLAEALEAMLPTAGPIQVAPVGEPKIIALVGPTGVGKTTTVAKLAANFCLRDGKKVGLITVDTYRIAAVQQLETYAQIIDVPLDVVTSAQQFQTAVARMSDRDVILVDTAGRSQRDTIKIKELQGLFKTVRPHEVHLVLSSTCGEAVLTEAMERFTPVGVDRVIFTKLDEAIGFGVILNCLQKANTQLSYVTTGQDVPDDIEVGQGKTLAELILEARA